MEPTLVSGDLIFSTSIFKRLLKKNNLVIFFDKTHSFIIKRISNINNNNIILKCDNRDSDSVFCQSPINKNKVLFVVLLIVKKKYVDFVIKCKKNILFFI